ncbi:hypothetical protein BG004_005798 [Podila humilis]|nr:hypothetical protein BG004_005798 [Podila humilis]
MFTAFKFLDLSFCDSTFALQQISITIQTDRLINITVEIDYIENNMDSDMSTPVGTPSLDTLGSQQTNGETANGLNGSGESMLVDSTNGTAENENEVKKEVLKNLYEQSTQYNHWRFTQAQLSERRSRMRQEAIDVIQTNIEEEKKLRNQNGLSTSDLPTNLNFLSVDEELALIGFYERKIVQIFRFWKLPSYATATSIAYMKRFFLENTPMEYHPKDVMLTCMFLARKTENFLMSIEDFYTVLKASANSAESILNLEFTVCKSIHFHFTVHHPYRPCLGFFYDMQAVTENMEKLQKVYEVALKLIDTSLYTDLCFLYQPSQIALAAMRIASREESYDFERYATYKFKATEESTKIYKEVLLPILVAIDNVLKQDPRCTDVEKTVASEIDKRLKQCKDPANDPESLLYKFRKRAESLEDDDDDDDDDDDRNDDPENPFKKQKVQTTSS